MRGKFPRLVYSVFFCCHKIIKPTLIILRKFASSALSGIFFQLKNNDVLCHYLLDPKVLAPCVHWGPRKSFGGWGREFLLRA